MSTNSIITEAYNDLTDAYNAVEEMGGTLPEQKNLANLEASVDSIGALAWKTALPDRTSSPYRKTIVVE